MIVTSKFSPSWWLSNPHLQTIVASKLARPTKTTSKAERTELSDGDFLDLNFSLKTSGPVVCLLHGLAGCINSAYIQGVFSSLENAGFRPVLMHWRGCSGEPNRLSRAYHSGASDDVELFVNLMVERFPGESVYAVGYSLGGNALLKYLGEQADATPLAGAMAVCPPLVLAVGAEKFDQGLTRGYQRYLLGQMRIQHEAKRMRYPELDLPAATPMLDNFWKFDDTITAPLHGFDDVHDYYDRCSARQFLPFIQRPTRILYALDDPFFTPAVLPEAGELAESVTLELSTHGGHVGFLGQTQPGSKTTTRWLDLHVADVIAGMHNSA
ncbi:MAG: hydrolase [Granulosicoccus sp.]